MIFRFIFLRLGSMMGWLDRVWGVMGIISQFVMLGCRMGLLVDSEQVVELVGEVMMRLLVCMLVMKCLLILIFSFIMLVVVLWLMIMLFSVKLEKMDLLFCQIVFFSMVWGLILQLFVSIGVSDLCQCLIGMLVMKFRWFWLMFSSGMLQGVILWVKFSIVLLLFMMMVRLYWWLRLLLDRVL